MDYKEEDIRNILERKIETPNIDYKEGLIWNKNNHDARLEIIKDILAMANTKDGGKIVFGVNDKNHDFIGISNESYDSFDVTPVNTLLHQYVDPTFTCNVVKRIVDSKKLVIIDVPEFTEVPIVCKKSANSTSNKEVLKKGGVYIRTNKCTSELVSTADEMRGVLGRGIAKKGDELLDLIQKVISGKPIKTSSNIKKQYEQEIKDAQTFFDANLNSKAGYWEIVVYPTPFESNRIPNQLEAERVVNDSIVHLRGWDFPHKDSHGNSSNFSQGKQSFTVSDVINHQEAWRMYKSGLFIWREYFVEDLGGYEEDGKKVNSFVNTIYSVTEFVLFLKRVYAEKLKVDSVHLSIVLTECKDRKLVALQTGTLISGYYSCKEDRILIEKDIQTADLQASFEGIAREIIREIFMLFNWNDPNETMLEDWQKKLIEKGG